MSQGPDKAEARDQSRPFPLHPKVELKPARLVDVINMGLSVIRFPGSDDYLAEQVVLVFYTGMKDHHGSGKTVNIEQRFTLSMGKKAKLRALIEGWRGDNFTPAEETMLKKEGFDPQGLEDPLYVLDTENRVYVPLDQELYARIQRNEVSL